MAKTKMLCPFSNKICSECPFYRGRHYFLCYFDKYRGYIDDSTNNRNPFNGDRAFPDFEALMKKIEPWKKAHVTAVKELSMKLKVIDMENMRTDNIREIEYSEAKEWDWKNTKMLRMIDGRHITSWEQLLEILEYKAERGETIVDVYEGPRFILLGGG